MIANRKRDLCWHIKCTKTLHFLQDTMLDMEQESGIYFESIVVGPRQTRGVGTWRSMFGCEFSFTVFMAFLTKFFSHRCLTLWNQTSRTCDFEVIRLYGPSLCTDLVALSSSDCTLAGKTSGIFQCLYAQPFTFCGCTYGSSVVVWF